MKVTCTGRRVTLKPSFIENAEKRLAKLDKFFPDEAQAQVTVTVEKSGQTVEIMLRSKDLAMRAEKTDERMEDALADAVDLLQRLENLEPDIEGTQADLRTLGSQLTTLQGDLNDAAKRLDELEDQDAVGTLADGLRQLERMLDSVQSAVNKAAQQAGDVSGQLTSIRSQLIAAGQKAQQIYEDLGDKIQALQDDDSGYSNQLTILALQQAQRTVGVVSNALSSENLPNFGQTAAEMQKQLQNIASRIGDGSTAIANLRDLVESMDGDFASFASTPMSFLRTSSRP